MCFIPHSLFTSILLHSVIPLSFMEQSGKERCCSHLTIKSIVNFSGGIHSKWMYYGWLWPSIAILIHGQMTQITLRSPKEAFLLKAVNEWKKNNEKSFCSEKHYLCSCCSLSVASPSHLATSLLEAKCGSNSLLMYICKRKWRTAFPFFSSVYDWQGGNHFFGKVYFFWQSPIIKCCWHIRRYFGMLSFNYTYILKLTYSYTKKWLKWSKVEMKNPKPKKIS